MKNFTLSNGKTYDESYFEKLSDEAAKGNYPGTPGEWVIRPQGRPKLTDEELVTIAFKVPASQRERIDVLAKNENKTRSQFIRSIVSSAIS